MRDIFKFFISTWYIWVIAFLTAIYQIFLPRIKGYFGEKSVAFFLSRLDLDKYKVIYNVMLNVAGKTTQIDHVVVSNFGIFVIETKNYKGWIMGDEYSEYWTQVIYKHREKLYNPIWQNYGHIQALKTYLVEFPTVLYIPIVAFTTKAELKITAAVDVIYTVNLPKTIRKYMVESVPDGVRDRIFSMLSTGNIVSKEERKKHVRDIHERLDSAENKIDSGICPKCGGNLVFRRGSRGSFRGCANYPKCRFTSNV